MNVQIDAPCKAMARDIINFGAFRGIVFDAKMIVMNRIAVQLNFMQ
jgi:hypothetical protein